jgi:hypothetical protein
VNLAKSDGKPIITVSTQGIEFTLSLVIRHGLDKFGYNITCSMAICSV